VRRKSEEKEMETPGGVPSNLGGSTRAQAQAQGGDNAPPEYLAVHAGDDLQPIQNAGAKAIQTGEMTSSVLRLGVSRPRS